MKDDEKKILEILDEYMEEAGSRFQRFMMDRKLNVMERNKDIPYICFPSNWEVKIIYPFAAAFVRFLVRLKDVDMDGVSVYLDVDDSLGYMGEPYWETYPIDGETERFVMNDVKGLLECIEKEFERRKNERNS